MEILIKSNNTHSNNEHSTNNNKNISMHNHPYKEEKGIFKEKKTSEEKVQGKKSQKQ